MEYIQYVLSGCGMQFRAIKDLSADTLPGRVLSYVLIHKRKSTPKFME